MKKSITIELIILGVLLFPVFTSFADESDNYYRAHLPMNRSILPRSHDKPYRISDKKLVTEFPAIITAYNLGDVNQNDSTPCTGAFNEDLCNSINNGELLVANNYYLPGTLVCIDKVGCGRIADRMNSRYDKDHFDIAMSKDDYLKAIKFGAPKLIVRIYKK
jgi:hypothetical protein